MAGGSLVVIDFDVLRERQNETVDKELCAVSAATCDTFRFKRPYKMVDHGSSDNS